MESLKPTILRYQTTDCARCGKTLTLNQEVAFLGIAHIFCLECEPTDPAEIVQYLTESVVSRTEAKLCGKLLRDGSACWTLALPGQGVCFRHLPYALKKERVRTCQATNTLRQPCGNFAVHGSDFCVWHAPDRQPAKPTRHQWMTWQRHHKGR